VTDPAPRGAAPRIEDHFEAEGLAGVLRKGHPYDARETYTLLRALYGYAAPYVNYGWWPEGAATHEPGRRLAFLAADAIAESLAPDPATGGGARLFEAGSGLGAAAVDLARRHGLARVKGANVSARQVGFANALARSEGLADRVSHVVSDAALALAKEPAVAFDAVLALECVSHFQDADAFLREALRALRRSGHIALTMNVARRAPTRVERALFRASYGFVPLAGEAWAERLARAGFVAVERRDLTRETIAVLADAALERLARPSPELQRIAWASRAWVALLFRAMRRGIASGALGYELVTARAGG